MLLRRIIGDFTRLYVTNILNISIPIAFQDTSTKDSYRQQLQLQQHHHHQQQQPLFSSISNTNTNIEIMKNNDSKYIDNDTSFELTNDMISDTNFLPQRNLVAHNIDNNNHRNIDKRGSKDIHQSSLSDSSTNLGNIPLNHHKSPDFSTHHHHSRHNHTIRSSHHFIHTNNNTNRIFHHSYKSLFSETGSNNNSTHIGGAFTKNNHSEILILEKTNTVVNTDNSQLIIDNKPIKIVLYTRGDSGTGRSIANERYLISKLQSYGATAVICCDYNHMSLDEQVAYAYHADVVREHTVYHLI